MNFKNGQKIYTFNGCVEEWTYYTGYDGKHLISNGKNVFNVETKELRKFYDNEHDY